MSSKGHFFENAKGNPLYKTNGMDSQQMMGFSGMWIVAKKSDDTKVGFISKEKSTSELKAGPIDTLFNKAVENPGVWDKVWYINQNDVKQHKASWRESSYTPTWGIANWPARHNQNYVPTVMAPFVDWNSDQRYDPSDGDYPYFRGDQMMYFIANDEGQEHKLSGAPSMVVEVQGQMFVKNETGLENVVFARLFIVNRSDEDYDSLFFSQYNYFYLGNKHDNYIASNVAKNSVYGYNGDENDEGGFGNKMPYAACVFLNHKLTSSIGFQAADTQRKFPENIDEVWNTVQGKWSNGNSMNYDSNGYANNAPVGRFLYPGKSDPNQPGQNWTNAASSDRPGLRNIMGSIGPYTLKNNGVIMVDLAFISGSHDDSISHSEIDNQIQKVQEHYQKTMNVPSSSINSNNVKVYPNPVPKGQNPIFECKNECQVRIYNITGKLVYNQQFTAGRHEINLRRIPGVYLVEIESEQNKSHFRLVLE